VETKRVKVSIIAVGKGAGTSEEELIGRYARRLKWQFDIREVEVKRPLKAAQRCEGEGKKLLDAVPGHAFVVVLDEGGKNLSSTEFAKKIEAWQVRGCSHIAFLLGGADGHSAAVRERAEFTLSLGKMTWPHMLARAMLVEQIYRAASILDGHPYHKT
jgi:23S rRNA (pseudouridine1915-N3)-methyltransferase